MTLFLYDTSERKKREFIPQNPKRVTMYLCGPTVYSFAHIGNFRPAVVFDTLVRLLRHQYGADHVVYARNITDVDDKINQAAADQGVDISAITQKFAQIYHDDSAALNVIPPDVEPTATGHMDAMISLISRLIEGGHAYVSQGHVLFDVNSYAKYGALSGRSLEDMQAGARVEVASYKRDPADFVLWKPSKAHEPEWEAPFGAGRPGWHTECAAMIEQNLGPTIDIHAGGQDLIFPHHENEIAQAACVHEGAPLAHYWLHNGFLDVDSEKMSKSLGNVKLPHEMLEQWPGEVLRYGLLSGHYRAPLDWTAELLERTKSTLDRQYGALRRLSDVEAADVPPPDAFIAALEDDLNTPKALAELSALVREANNAETGEDKSRIKGQILAAGNLIGLLQQDPENWFKSGNDDEAAEIDALVKARDEARATKNWAEADRIRDELNARNVVVEDGPDGSIWRKG